MASVHDMLEFLSYEFNVLVSKRTLFRTLENAGWSRKVALKHVT
jgi:hypothetical protein